MTPADRTAEPLEPIVATEGGPGYATTPSRGSYLQLFRPLLDRRDLLLVDNRGTGTSGAVRCPELQRLTFADYSDSPGVWLSAAGLAEKLITRLLREGVSDEELPQRVLDPAHFEFRGGEGAAARANSAR